MTKLCGVFVAIVAIGAFGCNEGGTTFGNDASYDDSNSTNDSGTFTDSTNSDSNNSNDGATVACDDSAPASSVDDFCTQYETTCDFGGANLFESYSDCYAEYEYTFTDDRRQCATYFLCVAGEPGADNVTTHCPHATGQAPCDQ